VACGVRRVAEFACSTAWIAWQCCTPSTSIPAFGSLAALGMREHWPCVSRASIGGFFEEVVWTNHCECHCHCHCHCAVLGPRLLGGVLKKSCGQMIGRFNELVAPKLTSLRKAVIQVLQTLHLLCLPCLNPDLSLSRSKCNITPVGQNDANDQNVLVDDSRSRVTGIIDFGDCLHTCVIFELV